MKVREGSVRSVFDKEFCASIFFLFPNETKSSEIIIAQVRNTEKFLDF